MAESALGRRSRKDGFILVVVLWILAALATLASAYSVYVANATFATQVNDDRVRIRNAVTSGIELAAYKMLAAPKDARPPQGAFAVRLGRSAIAVSFVSESARIDLNFAPKNVLVGLFTAVGVSPSQASTFADRIVSWRKKAGGEKPGGPGQNDEAAAYKEAGYDYAPRHGPFQTVLELPLVLGIPPYIVERVLPLVTVYSGSAQVDLRVAPPEILSTLPNMTPEQLQKVLAQRAQNPLGDGLTKLVGSAGAGSATNSSPAARVQVQVQLDNGRTARAEVVILVAQDDDEPFRVLSWRDDFDGST
jgi:general secretion pathway protein K